MPLEGEEREERVMKELKWYALSVGEGTEFCGKIAIQAHDPEESKEIVRQYLKEDEFEYLWEMDEQEFIKMRGEEGGAISCVAYGKKANVLVALRKSIDFRNMLYKVLGLEF